MAKQKIILASTSLRRHNLAQQMGLEFEIVPSDYEEDMYMKMSCSKLAMALAYGKAKDVSKKFNSGIVLGIDTFVVFNDKRLGKPKSKEEAYKMLKNYSGKNVKVYSGIALIDCGIGKEIKDYEVSNVKFKKITDEEIWNYISTGEPMDKAGAFAIQGLASIFIEKINGCYTNIVGFPVHCIYINLKKLGVNIFEYEKWKNNLLPK